MLYIFIDYHFLVYNKAIPDSLVSGLSDTCPALSKTHSGDYVYVNALPYEEDEPHYRYVELH